MEELVPKFAVFLLVLVRVASFFVVSPIFAYRTIPAMHKIGLSFFLAWIMYYTIKAPTIDIDAAYFLLIIKEAIVGLALGFIAYMIMSAVQMAGGFIDFQMGFAIANVIDPQTGAQGPLMGQYFYTITLLFLLATNGHHLLLDGIFYSYETIPINEMFIPFGDENVVSYMARAFNQTFLVAFQMSIPLVGSLFLVDVALGIVARTVPQVNIFVVGVPVKIIVSFIILIAVFGAMMMSVRSLFEYALLTMRGFMHLIGGT
ncbi:flagellar biosynthetic protein FliR [Peribacillus deserti]|uniref:Flagellar biosynthetic protein FliR n=1 Tax=Peribacillus deserti TaxID=673318 RepID=A0A2N5MB35_9BACI|nr:flagellar biosynthetic protein FliR [Peribacillus deserti]PLT31561.1 flagellar type III secretion system protein FliR [Peribacillus deserti]